MRKNLNGPEENSVAVYCLGGLATAPHFMENLRIAIEARIREQGLEGRPLPPGASVHSRLLFPYGDWSRSVMKQLWEIGTDVRLGLRRIERSTGGRRTAAEVEADESRHGSSAGMTLLIGHSGGGVAALHAAELLTARRSGECRVVMIGSPRCRVPDRLKPFVLSIAAQGQGEGKGLPGKSPDAVSRMGSHGGWRRRGWLPSWQRDKHAPEYRLHVPIIGRHADYFREREPHRNSEGKSNLDHIMEAIFSWLDG
jgi:hypothetical protein